MSEGRILSERRGHVLVITINRPEARNAFDSESSLALETAVDQLDEDDSLFVGVITGAGGHFSAGADLKAAARGGQGAPPRRGGFGMFAKPPRKPVIAAVEGFAVGGGFELCLACDLIVAARTARFGLPEVRHNVVAIGGGLFRLPRRMLPVSGRRRPAIIDRTLVLPLPDGPKRAVTGASVSKRAST